MAGHLLPDELWAEIADQFPAPSRRDGRLPTDPDQIWGRLAPRQFQTSGR
jgi:hypothetical protein